MKRSMIILAMLMLPLPAAVSSEEGIAKGIWLLDRCSENRESSQSMLNWTECVYYLNGLIDGYHLMRNMHTEWGTPVYDKDGGMCIQFPKSMTIGQMAGTVVHYLEKYPEQLQEPATMAAYNAFSDTFSCRE